MENRNATETTLPEKLLKKLLDFEPVDAPVISLYLDARADQHGQQNFLPFVRKQLTNRIKSYDNQSDEQTSLEEDFVRIVRYLETAVPASVQGLAIFPMFVPSIILSYAFIRVLGPNGTVDLLLNAVHLPKIRSPYLTPWGPVIGLVWDNIPLTVLILVSGLGNVSNQSIEAARDVGAPH